LPSGEETKQVVRKWLLNTIAQVEKSFATSKHN
jgi:hypothetical protein